jgi:hypothetical protein
MRWIPRTRKSERSIVPRRDLPVEALRPGERARDMPLGERVVSEQRVDSARRTAAASPVRDQDRKPVSPWRTVSRRPGRVARDVGACRARSPRSR